MLDTAVRAVGLFDVKFAPYPYESLSVVVTDLTDGKEYDGLVFLASEFYDSYGGSARSEMVSIGVHEIAHQLVVRAGGQRPGAGALAGRGDGGIQRALVL